MPFVYVVQDGKNRDYSPALKYGELKLLLPEGNIVLSTQPTVRNLKRKLKDFSDDDFLLLSGDPVGIGLATAIAAEANRGRVQFLKWEPRECQYYALQADLRGAYTDVDQ